MRWNWWGRVNSATGGVEGAVQALRSLYFERGHACYGEDISQFSHGLSCALLAREQGARSATILAAFYHDVGHLLESADTAPAGAYGRLCHDRWGADFLATLGFDEAVTELVRQHVQAKRYLAFRSASYVEQLSEASRISLLHQGGPMTASQALAFTQAPLHQEILALRRWDDAGKVASFTFDEADWLFALSADYLRAIKSH